MKTYEQMFSQIRKFRIESGIDYYDIMRIAKDNCCCGKCRFFVPHYLSDGELTDFGHCRKNKIPKATRPRDISCGFWEQEVKV